MRPAFLNRSTWLSGVKYSIAYIVEHLLAEEIGLFENVVDEHILGGLVLVEELSVLRVVELVELEVLGLREDE